MKRRKLPGAQRIVEAPAGLIIGTVVDDEADTGQNGDMVKRRQRFEGVRAAQANEPIVRLVNGRVEITPRSALTTGDVARALGRGVLATDEAETEIIETLPENRPGTPMKSEEEAPPELAGPAETWHAMLIIEGVPTGDKRLFEQGSLTWRDLPLPLMWQTEQPEMGGHAHSVHVAQITRIERQDDELHAWGYHLASLPEGPQWYDLLVETGKLGVSVDVDDADVEIDFPDEDESDDDDEPMLLFPEPELIRFTRGRLIGATCVPFPAFSEAFIEPLAAAEPVEQIEQPPVDDAAMLLPVRARASATDLDALIAAAIPVRPPSRWFIDPRLSGPTPLTIEETGRVFGHIALWGTCHTSVQGVCITPPHEESMDYFRTGEILTAEGDRIPVGTYTFNTGHAEKPWTATQALAHYDNTGTAAADFSCGPDEHGIWVAGALRPDVTPEQIRALRGARPSGDWRRINGRLRLVGVLAVNVPGFPVPRVGIGTHDGVQTALVAAGMVPITRRPISTRGDFAAIADRLARSIGLDTESRVAALVQRVHGGQ